MLHRQGAADPATEAEVAAGVREILTEGGPMHRKTIMSRLRRRGIYVGGARVASMSRVASV